MTRNAERERYMAIGLAIGMPSFALIGFALCLVTDNLGLLGVWPAMGLAMGIAIGEGLYQRNQQRGA
jgi:Na+-driven multidrug efflux pump